VSTLTFGCQDIPVCGVSLSEEKEEEEVGEVEKRRVSGWWW
jgi:hypothetical protein